MTVNPEFTTLQIITDRRQTGGRRLVDVVKSALGGGVRLVQLREKDLSSRELFTLAMELREMTTGCNSKLLINDRVDIALAVGADGVHLGRQSVSVQDARRAFKCGMRNAECGMRNTLSELRTSNPEPLIGVSTHSLDEALQAEADGADFITFGPVYYTPSKAQYGDPLGIERLKEVAKAVNIPVYAIGGIKTGNIEEVMKAGAYGVATISAIMAADDVKKAAEDIILSITGHIRVLPKFSPQRGNR